MNFYTSHGRGYGVCLIYFQKSSPDLSFPQARNMTNVVNCGKKIVKFMNGSNDPKVDDLVGKNILLKSLLVILPG